MTIDHIPVANVDSDPQRRALLAGLGGLAAGALLVGARTAKAGPLTPPPGAVAPTGRTTEEIFNQIGSSSAGVVADARRGWTPISASTTPGIAGVSRFRIAQPGCYYLTSNIDPGTEPAAIRIDSDNVTLDLNGFAVNASGSSRIGIATANFSHNSIRICNGFLNLSTTATGIFAISDHLLIEDVAIIAESGAVGVTLSGVYGVVFRRCRFWARASNPGAAITALTGARSVTYEDVTLSGDGTWAAGLAGASFSVARRCTLGRVAGSAISFGESSLVETCSAIGCGIVVGPRSAVVDCHVDIGPGIGIDGGSQCQVERCRSTGNATGGIRVGSFSLVRACFVDLHQATAGQFGIKAIGDDVQVIENAIGRCNIGIDFQNVSGCVALRNTLRRCPNTIAVSAGGNWYPFVDFSSLNTATNPFANLFTNA